MTLDYPHLLNELINLSWEAARPILEIYNEDFEVAIKSDKSPVTEADIVSHGIIFKGLSHLTPHIPIVSEEDSDLPSVASDIFWLVDPLDGTKEFISHNGEFTVNIALIEKGQPVLGVVRAPALGVCYAGIVGQGAFKIMFDAREKQFPIRSISKVALGNDVIKVVGSRSHGDPSLMDDFLSNYKNHEFIPVGSSLKFCHLAEGMAHIYPRFGRTMEWDTAAGQAVLMAAGGSVCSLDGTPLKYGKLGFENPPFIAKAFCF